MFYSVKIVTHIIDIKSVKRRRTFSYTTCVAVKGILCHINVIIG